MSEDVYLLTKRGVLHRAQLVHGQPLLQTFEGDNLDAAAKQITRYENEMEARRAADRLCRRCFPGDRLRK